MAEDNLMTPWPKRAMEPDAAPAVLRGGPEYARLHAAHRLLDDRLAGAALDTDVEREVAARLEELNDLLAAHQVPERDRIDGWRPDLPGRGHPLLPPFFIDSDDAGTVHGRVTFTRLHLGGGNAVHGGVPPLLFDDVLGRVVNHGQAAPARTAFLHVDFRRVVPLDVELPFTGTLVRIDGRKRYASGVLSDADGHVLVEAHGLFVELRPGQP
jgi:acyl-coenzyme A thioesterase PaaI-like protein